MISKLYRAFLREGFFTTKEALGIIPNENTCMHTLRRLLKTKQIAKVRKGVYEIIPLEHVGDGKPAADKFLLARKIVSPYCLAYHSALEIHGVANSPFYNTVHVTSPSQFRSFTYEGIHYKWLPRKQLLGSETAIWSTARIFVTDRERTIIDCIDRVDLAGGFEEAFKSVSSIRNVVFDRLYGYAKVLNKKILFHKLGFLLSLPPISEAWSVDSGKLAKVRRELSSKIYYFETSKGHGQLVREWNVIVPSKIEELMEPA